MRREQGGSLPPHMWRGAAHTETSDAARRRGGSESSMSLTVVLVVIVVIVLIGLSLYLGTGR